MNNFNWADYEVDEPKTEEIESGFDWKKYEEPDQQEPENQPQEKKQEEESNLQSAIRTAWQPVAGFLQATTPGIATGFWQLLATGEAYDPEAIDQLEAIAQREGVPFDRDQYMKAAETALAYIPTVGNLERIAEEQTGAPLQAKTGTQKALRLGSTAATLSPGTIVQKGAAGVTAPAVSAGLTKAGVPEPISEIAGLGTSIAATKATPAINPIGLAKKPSGLTERRFESGTKPNKVSSHRYQKINEKVEGDFRRIADDIIEKSPAKETFSNLKENIDYKTKTAESFKEVEELAKEIPDTISTEKIGDILLKKANERSKGGFVTGEYEDSYNDFINSYLKKMREKEVTNEQLVRQYRKNNEELGKIYESGKSTAYNDAKKDATLDFNRSIADLIEKEYPSSSYSNLFKESNSNWSKIMDAEQINQFLDDLFEGKIQYKKGQQFFDKNRITRPFKRALGDEGFDNFKTLMEDLMSSKEAMSLLKIAEQRGYSDFAKSAGAYLIHPKLGALKTLHSFSKEAFKATLDKPKLMIIWKKGIDAAKKGKFGDAEKLFSQIRNETQKKSED